ncbi:MAG: hypothetical protein NZM06_10285 [Chloroherpetonaceae bacterium]|nr:hypothetical protein [Chloroherpetonaceae bacterium]
MMDSSLALGMTRLFGLIAHKNETWMTKKQCLNEACASLFVILNGAQRSEESTFGEASEFNSQLTIRNPSWIPRFRSE